MPSIASFTDFVRVQTPAIWGDADEFVIDAQLNNRTLWGCINRGRNLKQTVQGGRDIRFYHLDARGVTTEFYNPADPGNPSMQQVTSEVVYPWVHWRDTSIAWQNEIISKNVTSDAGFRTKAFKNELMKIKKAANARVLGFCESMLSARPDRATMEDGAGTLKVNSLHVMVNEFANGLVPAAIDQGGLAWTTVGGRAPATNPEWVPVRESYTNSVYSTPGNLYEALGSAYRRSCWNDGDFETAGSPDSMRAPNVNAMTGKPDASMTGDHDYAYIATTNLGFKLVTRMKEAGNDLWTNRNDPVSPIQYAGVPIVWASSLDNYAFWPTGTAGAPGLETSTLNSNAGPRFLGLRSGHLNMVFQAGWMNHMEGPIVHPNNPTGASIWRFFAGNLVCDSRKHLFCVFPEGNQS